LARNLRMVNGMEFVLVMMLLQHYYLSLTLVCVTALRHTSMLGPRLWHSVSLELVILVCSRTISITSFLTTSFATRAARWYPLVIETGYWTLLVFVLLPKYAIAGVSFHCPNYDSCYNVNRLPTNCRVSGVAR
jgi:hypothetical protein